MLNNNLGTAEEGFLIRGSGVRIPSGAPYIPLFTVVYLDIQSRVRLRHKPHQHAQTCIKSINQAANCQTFGKLSEPFLWIVPYWRSEPEIQTVTA